MEKRIYYVRTANHRRILQSRQTCIGAPMGNEWSIFEEEHGEKNIPESISGTPLKPFAHEELFTLILQTKNGGKTLGTFEATAKDMVGKDGHACWMAYW